MNKLSILLLPLLVSILLSTLSNLKIGGKINSLTTTLLSPVTHPTAIAKGAIENNLAFIHDLPQINQENLSLKKQNSLLISENQKLKDSLSDQEALKKATSPFKEVVPVRIINIGKTITTTTSHKLDSVKSGQSVISGTTLLGFVDTVSGQVIHVIPLDSDYSSRFGVKTTLGQKGVYVFNSRIPQIIDVPSENPLTLNDTVITLPSEDSPGNLVVGKITKIISSPQEPLQKAEIKLETVFSSNPTDIFIIVKP